MAPPDSNAEPQFSRTADAERLQLELNILASELEDDSEEPLQPPAARDASSGVDAEDDAPGSPPAPTRS